MEIPIVGAVYRSARQLIDSFTGTSESGFKRVVIIEYPRTGICMVGYLTAITTTRDGEMGMGAVPINEV